MKTIVPLSVSRRDAGYLPRMTGTATDIWELLDSRTTVPQYEKHLVIENVTNKWLDKTINNLPPFR